MSMPVATSTKTTPFKLHVPNPNRERIETFKLFAPHCLDSYKLGHKDMYAPNTEYVYSNFTVRSDKHLDIPLEFNDHKYVVYNVYGVFRDIVALWDESFFQKPKEECLAKYRARVPAFTGKEAAVQHLSDLHDLGYLPLRVKTLNEGSYVNVGIPFFTIVNTLPEYFWLTNALETHISDEMWKGITIATLAYVYRRMFETYAEITGSPKDFIGWQGHCFADRGMSGHMDAAKNCSAHSVPFLGTDSVSAHDWLDFVYKGEETFKGGSVPASEHSVAGSFGPQDEREYFRLNVVERFPVGVVSLVSDTWDYWNVVTNIIPSLKAEIKARQFDSLGLSKVVLRPDSGDPADILCGTAPGVPELSWEHIRPIYNDLYTKYLSSGRTTRVAVYCKGKYYEIEDGPTLNFKEVTPTPQERGSIDQLMSTMSYTTTDKGYRVLWNRLGHIYGDSITPERCLDILQRLAAKDIASCNVVLGIGSYTYQHITRDTLGMAIKATWVSINGNGVNIFKAPKTDDGTKKSAKGLLKVLKSMEQDKDGKDVEKYHLVDQVDWDEEDTGELKLMFENGNFVSQPTLAEIRTRLGV